MDEAGRLKREERMGIGVIADFVSGRSHFAGHAGQSADIRAALKEGGRSAVASEDFEQMRRWTHWVRRQR